MDNIYYRATVVNILGDMESKVFETQEPVPFPLDTDVFLHGEELDSKCFIAKLLLDLFPDIGNTIAVNICFASVTEETKIHKLGFVPGD